MIQTLKFKGIHIRFLNENSGVIFNRKDIYQALEFDFDNSNYYMDFPEVTQVCALCYKWELFEYICQEFNNSQLGEVLVRYHTDPEWSNLSTQNENKAK